MCQYKVVTSTDLQDLIKQVNEHTKSDWRPHGSFQAVFYRHLCTCKYFQALIKD